MPKTFRLLPTEDCVQLNVCHRHAWMWCLYTRTSQNCLKIVKFFVIFALCYKRLQQPLRIEHEKFLRIVCSISHNWGNFRKAEKHSLKLRKFFVILKSQNQNAWCIKTQSKKNQINNAFFSLLVQFAWYKKEPRQKIE